MYGPAPTRISGGSAERDAAATAGAGGGCAAGAKVEAEPVARARLRLRRAARPAGDRCGWRRRAGCAGAAPAGAGRDPAIGELPGGICSVGAAAALAVRRRDGGLRSAAGRIDQRRRTAAERQVALRADVDRREIGRPSARATARSAASAASRCRSGGRWCRCCRTTAASPACAEGRESLCSDRRSSSRSSPASRFDSPSRSRSLVVTLRELNAGSAWPAMIDVAAARAVLQREVEHDVAFVGHARRHLDDDADRAVAERRQRVGGARRPSPAA